MCRWNEDQIEIDERVDSFENNGHAYDNISIFDTMMFRIYFYEHTVGNSQILTFTLHRICVE